MKKLTIALIALVLVALAVLTFGYFEIQALFQDTVIDEPLPAEEQIGSPDELAPTQSGVFVQGDSSYTISGAASVVTSSDGIRTLVLEDFSVTNGPDLFVYLVKGGGTNQDVKNLVKEELYVNLGKLKGNIGDQTYDLPSDLIIEDGYTVSIWCKRFGRNFGSALLE